VELPKRKKFKKEIVTSLKHLSLDCALVDFPPALVVSSWKLRNTTSRAKRLQGMKDEENVNDFALATETEDGPLDFMYRKVFSVMLKLDPISGDDPDGSDEEEEEFPKNSIKCFFYDKWAEQMSALVEKGDDIRLKVDGSNVFNDDKVEYEEDCNFCICVGSEAEITLVEDDGSDDDDVEDDKDSKVTFKSDENCEIRVTSYPRRNAATADARAVDIILDSTNVGLVEKQQMEVLPYNHSSTKRIVDNGIVPLSKEDKKNAHLFASGNYVDLIDLKSLLAEGSDEEKVNVFAVILGANPPRQVRNGSWMVSLTLIDESCSDPGSAVVLNVFNDDTRKLPICAKAGDVVRCHRVKAQMWEGSVQLLGTRQSSFNVVRRTTKSSLKDIAKEKGALDLAHWEVNSTALISTLFTPAHGAKFRTLWLWAQKRLQSAPSVVSELKLSIDSISEDVSAPSGTDHDTKFGDITCMVTAMIPTPADQISDISPRGFLRIWDGTGPPKSDPLPINSLFASDAVSNGDPPAACVQKIERIISEMDNDGDDDDSDLSAPPALCGRVINVAVWENAHWLYLTSGWMGTNFADLGEERRIEQAVSVGDWIRLRNVSDGVLGKAQGGIRALHLREKSGLTILPSSIYEVGSILRNHAERVSNKDPFNKTSAILNGTKGRVKRGREAENVPLAQKTKRGFDLYNLAECLGEPAPSELYVRCQAEEFIPNINGVGEDFTAKALRNLCVKSSADSDDWTFQFAIHIADHSAELDLIVAAAAAEEFMGIDPKDLFSKKKSTKKAAVEAGLKRIEEIKSNFLEVKIMSKMVGSEKCFILAEDSENLLVGGEKKTKKNKKSKSKDVEEGENSEDENTGKEAEEPPKKKTKTAKTPAKKSNSAKKTPAKSSKKTPAKSSKKTPAKSSKKTPAKSSKKTPAKSTAKTPAKSAKKTPAKKPSTVKKSAKKATSKKSAKKTKGKK